MSKDRTCKLCYYTVSVNPFPSLNRMKGSDASWANDEEPPRECLDYSDDEQERNAKKKKALEKGKRKDARRK